MKALTISWKDTLIRFRDRNGILLMLAAPLILAAIMGAAFGGLGASGGSNSPLSDIPFAVVNDDAGALGQSFVDILFSEDLADLLAPQQMDDLGAARALVEQGELRAAVYIPADFTIAISGEPMPDPLAGQTTVQVLTDPTATISPAVVQAVVTQILTRFNAAAIAGRISVEQALAHQASLGPGLAGVGAAIAETLQAQFGPGGGDDMPLQVMAVGSQEQGINPLAYFAPSMAILFLMFTLFDAARSILEEERAGTLARLMSTPSSFGAILAGKIGGVFFTGVLQLTVLIVASRLLFNLGWGSSVAGLALMVVAVVAAASSLGAFITAYAGDVNQANVIGSAVALIFAILGGNFILASAYPAWLQPFSKLTINRWALDGFTDLTLRGQGFADILPEAGVLLGLSVLFFTLAVRRLPQRFVR